MTAVRRATVLLLLLPTVVFGGGHPSGTSTLPLLAARGTDLACNQGDWTNCPNAQGGLASNKFHAFFVEVPPGTGNLTLEVFDADVGAGGGAEFTAGRDTAAATAAQAVEYSLLNPAGAAQAIRFARGNGVAAIGATTTGLATAGGTAVSCSTSGTSSADNAWCQVFATPTPAAGHWELRIASVAGTPIHYFGVRARDTATNRDLNVYTRSYFHFGNQSVDAGRSYAGANALFPYVTEGCRLRAADFDSDNEGTQSLRFASRSGVFDQTLTEANADLSANDAWNDELLTFTSDVAAREYGIWRFEFSSGTGTANHVTPWCGSELSAASPPTTQPQGGTDRGPAAAVSGESYRYYLPNNAGGPPAKPFVEQRLFFVSGANPPTANGGVSRLQVTIAVRNPTPYPIEFSATNNITASVPASTGGGGNALRFGNFSAPTADCGAATISGAGDAARNLAWNPGIIAANTTCTLFYQFDVDAPNNAAGGTRIEVTGNGAGIDAAETTARFLDETGTRFVFGPLCPLAITLGANVVVPVTLAHVDAQDRGGGRVLLRFATDTEAGTIGFHVAEGGRRLTTAPLAARGGNAIGWQDYEVNLDGWRGGPLAIEEIASGGAVVRHGPFTVGTPVGRALPPAPYDWSGARAERGAARRAAALRGAAAGAELLVDQAGPQRVTQSALAAAGVSLDGVPVAELALLRGDDAVPIAVDGGATWGPGSALRFVGEPLSGSVYAKAAVYRLLRDPARARRIGTRLPAAVEPAPRASAPREVRVAPDTAWSFAAPTDDPWYAAKLERRGNARDSTRLTLAAPDAVPGTPSFLRVALWGGIDYPEGADHAVSLAFNGAPLGIEGVDRIDRFDGVNPRWIDHPLAAGALAAGNTLEIALEPVTGREVDIVHVEGATLRYEAWLRAADGRVGFALPSDEPAPDTLFDDGFGDGLRECAGGSACAAWRATGFDAPDVRAYRVAQGRVDELAVAVETTAGGFAARIAAPDAPGARFLLATGAGHHAPAVRARRATADLLGAPATWLAIGPESLLPAIAPLLAARNAEGLAARAVAIEDLYAQGATGDVDPQAVRAFIARAHAQAGTRYVLLVGGDTYDYRNLLGSGSISHVPTFYRPTHPLLRHGPTDLPYGDLDDDGRLDLALGRFPGRTAAEIERLVAKTLAHAAASPAAATFAADIAGNGVDFGAASDAMIAGLDPAFAAARPAPDAIYLGPLDVAQGRSALFGAINGGRSLVSYVGHASPLAWTFSGLLRREDVDAGVLGNTRPFVGTQWGCWGAFFVDPAQSTLAHSLLVGGSHGAAALFGATGLTETASDEAFAAELLPRLTAGGGARIGDAFRDAQSAFAASHPQARDVWLGTVLLGDPALRLR
jgi:hypothetical protein